MLPAEFAGVKLHRIYQTAVDDITTDTAKHKKYKFQTLFVPATKWNVITK